MSSVVEAAPVAGVDMATHAAREGASRTQAFFESNPKIKATAEVIGYLGFYTLSVRSAGFVFLATPIGISGGLVYGSAAYLSNRVCDKIFKGDFAYKEIFKFVAGSYIAKTTLSLVLGVKISFTASCFIPFATALAGIIGAGTAIYWAATALTVGAFACMAFGFEGFVQGVFENMVAREGVLTARAQVVRDALESRGEVNPQQASPGDAIQQVVGVPIPESEDV